MMRGSWSHEVISTLRSMKYRKGFLEVGMLDMNEARYLACPRDLIAVLDINSLCYCKFDEARGDDLILAAVEIKSGLHHQVWMYL